MTRKRAHAVRPYSMRGNSGAAGITAEPGFNRPRPGRLASTAGRLPAQPAPDFGGLLRQDGLEQHRRHAQRLAGCVERRAHLRRGCPAAACFHGAAASRYWLTAARVSITASSAWWTANSSTRSKTRPAGPPRARAAPPRPASRRWAPARTRRSSARSC